MDELYALKYRSAALEDGMTPHGEGDVNLVVHRNVHYTSLPGRSEGRFEDRNGRTVSLVLTLNISIDMTA